MGFFTRTKTPDPPPKAPPGPTTKIMLNLRGPTSASVQQIAKATLTSGGFEEPPPKALQVGDRMPDGTIYAGISPDTGQPMYATPADASLTMKWKEAMDYAAKLDAHGHQDWRLPSKAELGVLFNTRAAIGGFDVTGSNPAGWYWSGTQDDEWSAWALRISAGCQGDGKEGNRSSVRCVRCGQ